MNTRRRGRGIEAALGLVTTIGVTLTAIPSASADTPGCASKHELHRLRIGMTQSHVHRILDTDGVVTFDSGGGQVRRYKTCGGGHRKLYYVYTDTFRLKDKNY